jgi:hypothetical protein
MSLRGQPEHHLQLYGDSWICSNSPDPAKDGRALHITMRARGSISLSRGSNAVGGFHMRSAQGTSLAVQDFRTRNPSKEKPAEPLFKSFGG